MQPASLIRGSENIKTHDKDTPPPHLSTLSHESEVTAWSTFSAALVSASPFSPSPNLDYPISALIAVSSTLFDSSSGNPPNTQSEGTEEASHEKSLSAYGGLSFLLPSSPYITLYTTSDFHFPSSSVSPPQIKSLSQSLKNNQKYSLFQGSGGCLSDAPTNTHRKEEETPSSLSFQLYKDNPLAPIPSLVLDSKSKFNNGCTTLPCLSPNPSIPVRQSSFSSKSCDPDGLIVPAVGTISDMTEQSISPQDRSYCHDNTDSETEDPLQINGKGEVEGEKHSDTVQTGEAVVYNSDTESSASLSVSILVSKDVCNKTEILHELSTKLEESRTVCHMDVNVSESQSPRSSSVLHDDAPEAQSRTKVETKDLIEIDSLDLIFQTSVDGSEGENGDVDAFFQQVDTEGLVYWAEPIQVSNPTPVPEESGSSEASDGCSGNYLLPRDTAALDSFPSDRHMPSSPTTMDTDQTLRNASTASSNTPSSLTLASFPSPLAIPDLKSSSCSVSVQMSSSLSSHIVHRKDIPYMTNSKCTLLSSVLPLDTSTPFRAVQSWTDLQIQQNTLTNKLSRGALHTVPNKVSVYTSASETTQRPTLTHDCFPRMARNYRTVSVSVDKGLWPDEEVDRNGNDDEDKLCEGNQTATMACYCACDHQCICRTQKSYNKQHTLGNIPVSNNTLSILYPYSAFFYLSFNQTQESYQTLIACVTFRLQSSSVTCLSGLNVHWKYYRIGVTFII